MKKMLKSFPKLEKRKLKNRLIKGVCAILSCLSFSLCIPPFQIYADSITSSNIVGVERTLTNMELVLHDNSNFDKYNFIYNFEVLLDKSYIGWINISVGTQFTYSTKSGNQYQNNTGSFTTPSRTYYVNGNSFNISSSVEINLTPGMTNMDIDPAKGYNPTFTLNSSNVTELASIESLSDVIDILNDINDVVSIDVMAELQTIVSNTSLSNDYLEILNQMNRYNIPIESLNANAPYWNPQRISDGEIELLDFYQYIYHDYPIYKLNTGPENYNIFYGYLYPDDPVDIIYIAPGVSNSQMFNYIDIVNGNVTTSLSNPKASFNMRYPDNLTGTIPAWYCFKLHIESNLTDSRQVLRVRWKTTPVYFIPIYVGRQSETENIGTEFALNWGLTNRYLKTLDVIAQGTTESNSAATGLDSETSSFESVASGLYTSENSFNQSMNSNLQQIDTSFNPSTSFGSKFLYSADWVRSQFNTLTSQTPFGSVLSFSMLLGLSLLIIGKVFK